MTTAMDGFKSCCFVILIVVMSLTIIAEAQSTGCGYNNVHCNSDEVCEAKVKGGTCYKRSDKISCNFLYYCYKPTICCGYGSCCPANSKCCNLNTCCPENSVCCGTSCCGSDSTCNGAYCEAKSGYGSSYTFSWYYILFIILPLVAVCGAMGRRMRYRRAMMHQTQSGRIILTNDFPSNSASPAAPTTISDSTFAPPPAYNDIVTGPQTGFVDEASKAKMPEPPPYSEVANQPAEFGVASVQPIESANTNTATPGSVNLGFETAPIENSAART